MNVVADAGFNGNSDEYRLCGMDGSLLCCDRYPSWHPLLTFTGISTPYFSSVFCLGSFWKEMVSVLPRLGVFAASMDLSQTDGQKLLGLWICFVIFLS